MLQVQLYSTETRETGIVTCREIVFGYELVHVCGIEDITGAVDIIDITHHTNAVTFSVDFADIERIRVVKQHRNIGNKESNYDPGTAFTNHSLPKSFTHLRPQKDLQV